MPTKSECVIYIDDDGIYTPLDNSPLYLSLFVAVAMLVGWVMGRFQRGQNGTENKHS